MTYDEILKLESLEERESSMIQYYINDVKVLDWIYDEKKYQHFVFNDREEFKYDNKYHRLDGPAIMMKTGIDEYYINGKRYTKEEWQPIALSKLRLKKLSRILDKS